MTFNSDQIIQEVYAEFEQMIDFVTNEAYLLNNPGWRGGIAHPSAL